MSCRQAGRDSGMISCCDRALPPEDPRDALIREQTAQIAELREQGYIDTASKHGHGACEALYQLMPGNPWMPPA